METPNKILLSVIALVSIGVALLWLQPAVEKQLLPGLRTAWVAIETSASGGVAEVAPQQLTIDQTFTLHAVLEAEERSGAKLYYSEAKRLRIGGQDVPAEQLRPWARSQEVKVRWYTLEGNLPFVELEPGKGLEGFRLQPFFRSDWPVSWSIPGEIDAAHDDHLAKNSVLGPRQLFGTQHYQVRIEIYATEDGLIPSERYVSWGIEELAAHPESFPSVSLRLANRAGPASAIFGLSQLEPPPGVGAELLATIDDLARKGLAWSRLTVLRDQIHRAGKRLEGLEWRPIDLTGDLPWGEGVAAGDLLRVGDRVVVLYEDRGTEGLVDYGDLCFDFVKGASVRPLGEVFSGEGEIVELASLG